MCAEILLQLLVGRPGHLTGRRSRNAQLRPLVVLTAVQAAEPLFHGPRAELWTAFRAYAPIHHANVASAVRVERGGAVRAHDSQVLEAVVASVAVDVVEDQGHPAASPKLALATQLAPRLLQPFLIQAFLQMPAIECRVLDHDRFERSPSRRPWTALRRVGVEMVSGDSPPRGPLSERRCATAAGAHAHPAHRFRVRHRSLDGSPCLQHGVSRIGSSHSEHMFAYEPDGIGAGEPGFEPGPQGAKSLHPAVRPLPRENQMRRYHRRCGPSGACVGSALGLLRCPFRRRGRLGARCPGLALPSGPG